MEEQWIKVSEAAKIINKTTKTVENWGKKGFIKTIKKGRSTLYYKDDCRLAVGPLFKIEDKPSIYLFDGRYESLQGSNNPLTHLVWSENFNFDTNYFYEKPKYDAVCCLNLNWRYNNDKLIYETTDQFGIEPKFNAIYQSNIRRFIQVDVMGIDKKWQFMNFIVVADK